MKSLLLRAAALIFAASLVCSLASCTRPAKDSETTSSGTTSSSTPDETAPPEPQTPLEKITVPLNSKTEGIKILGVRNLASETVINADWTASGIEFFAECEGEMTFDIYTQGQCYYRVFVDDVPQFFSGNYYADSGANQNKVIKINNLTRGTHKIRLVKVAGYTLSKAQFKSITLNGKILSEAPADNDIYLEFVGDSITCGWGNIGAFDGTYSSQDATLAYPYIVAQNLNADYSMTALSGQGICTGNPGIPLGYKYACHLKNSTTEWAFERKADAVIINIGTNDYNKADVTAAQFEAAFKTFVEYVRAKNGADCAIIGIYNVMNDTYADNITKVFKELGGTAANYYTYKADRANGNKHPSQAEHAAYAVVFTGLIKSILEGTYTDGTPGGTSKLPTANSAVVNADFAGAANGTKKTFEINGKSYEVTIGLDAFATFDKAHDAVTAGGTVYLAAGTYGVNMDIKKNLTILGPKAGISPNVRGQNKTDDWTLSPNRGTGEAVITSDWGLGVRNAVVYDCNRIVIDGVMFSEKALLRQNSGNAGSCEITLKNILIKGSTTGNNIFFFRSYYPDSHPNLYTRKIIIEELRVDDNLAKELMYLCSVDFEAKGVYMSASCDKDFIQQYWLDKTGTVYNYTITDSMFRGKTTAIKFDMKTNPAEVASKQRIDLLIKDNVFVASSASSPIISILIGTENVHAEIISNTFIGEVSGVTAISNSGSTKLDYSGKFTIKNNTFENISTKLDFTSINPVEES